MLKYSFVCTCFDRYNELFICVDSFIKNADIMPYQWIFIDDSGTDTDDIKKVVKSFNLSNCVIVKNIINIGQLASIDVAYSVVECDYIFHCEEDWVFCSQGFIALSYDILKKYDDIICVWLRDKNDTNNHRVLEPDWRLLRLLATHHGKNGLWNGFTLNPSLRRLSDYKIIAPFSKFESEATLSYEYYKFGFRACLLSADNEFVKHIGIE